MVLRQGQGQDEAQKRNAVHRRSPRIQADRPGTSRFTPAQIEFLSNILRLWRGEQTELIHNSFALLDERGLAKGYVDVPGLCNAASLKDVEAQGWSLNPGRYVGATAREAETEDFRESWRNCKKILSG